MARAPSLLVVLVLALAASASRASADQDLRIPRAPSPVTLDGRPHEAAWSAAAQLPVESVDVPAPPPTGGFVPVTPLVRLLVAEGRLCVAVEVAEDPGTAMGLHLLVAPDEARTAAEAVSLGYRPVELRAPRYAVRGPRGADRRTYRLEGAARWDETGRWSAEVAVPLVDLVGDARDSPLRLALVVFTRTPNVVAAAPPGVRWTAPGDWQRILPPAGAWPTAVEVDAERLAVEDRADRERRLAWLAWQQASAAQVAPLRAEEELREQVEGLVFAPLARILEHRPDLRVPVLVLRGDSRHRLGLADLAAADFSEAVELAPGWREAQYGLHVQVQAQRLASGQPGEASDYDEALGVLDVLAPAFPDDPWAQEGIALARGLLLYKRGDFAGATALLEPLGARYPHDAFIEAHAAFARQAARAWEAEQGRRERDASRGLPRAVLVTTKGRIVIELYEDDAPNTVSNFVWLAKHAFYDGLAFHRILPFFLVQGGDCHTRPGAADGGTPGTGTPGYAIRSEPNPREPLRGALAMAHAGRDTEGSQFCVLTGTAMHLRGEQTVFGRVVEGQEVAERLGTADRIRSVTLERLDPQRTYRPTTVAGAPAPEPRCR